MRQVEEDAMGASMEPSYLCHPRAADSVRTSARPLGSEGMAGSGARSMAYVGSSHHRAAGIIYCWSRPEERFDIASGLSWITFAAFTLRQSLEIGNHTVTTVP